MDENPGVLIFSGREMVVLCLLILCVPAQYWIADQWTDSSSPQQVLVRLGKDLDHFTWLWVESLNWWKRLLQIIAAVRGQQPTSRNEECPAKEVALFRERTGYFGLSPEQRPNRPGYINHRVGQVIRLIKKEGDGAVGVIIGWDLYARAPDSWLTAQYGTDKESRKEPHYRVLLSRPISREVYIPQGSFEVLRGKQVDHPRVAEMFSHFDGAQYLPRETLRQLYPQD